MKRILSALLAVALCLSFVACNQAAKPKDNEEVVPVVYGIKGPTAVGLVNMMDDEDDDYKFQIVGSPDEIVGKIATKEVDIAAIPTNLAAKLYKKTDGGVLMLACNTLGVLSVIENGNTIKSVADLKGKTILSTGQGSNPEYILKYVLSENGIDPEKDVTLQFVDDNDTLSAQLLASEAGTVAMVPQPAATAVLVKATQQNLALTKVLDINTEWNKVAEKDSLIMGCMVVRKEFAEQNPAAVKKFLDDYQDSIKEAQTDIEDTAELCEEYGVIPSAALAQKAIGQCNITYIAGSDMQKAIEPYFQILFNADPTSIGGAVPDANFYYTK
ncbi:MAG: PhnD/SsuA/transferrin family substrate-binding protein [Clostridia bacterium]|nr:PhnD/SsuA/transferrin family substrate-binding protein [Clostridia bacterium]MBQ7289162.1 PhnD/SsuA/transferrin family substrate-binding protein [Clostridia bacterium]